MKESRTNLNASACIHRGKLYVFGGEQKGSHWKDYHGTECYDFNTGTWSYFKSLIPIFKKKKVITMYDMKLFMQEVMGIKIKLLLFVVGMNMAITAMEVVICILLFGY